MSGWHDFFILAGTAAATLVGLLFVGLLRLQRSTRLRLLLRFGMSSVSYVGIIVAGILLFSSPNWAFTVLVTAIIVLLVVALRNTWDLLVTVGDVTLGREREKD